MLLQLHMDTMGVDIETRLDFSKHRNRYLSWVSETKLRGYKIGHDPQLSARLVSDLKVTGYEHDRFMLSWDDLTDRNTGPVFHTTWP